MRKLTLSFVLAGLLLVGILGLIRVASGQSETGADGLQVVREETDGDNLRQLLAPEGADASRAPDISFIDSPTASCYKPDPAIDTCYINWYYMSVSASPDYIITMTVTINDFGPVGHYQGFFQTSMYVPYNMHPQGFQVACGGLGAGGNPQLGNAYAYTIRARDSAGLKSANYGTVYCPASTP